MWVAQCFKSIGLVLTTHWRLLKKYGSRSRQIKATKVSSRKYDSKVSLLARVSLTHYTRLSLSGQLLFMG